jgi:hypothetical protein
LLRKAEDRSLKDRTRAPSTPRWLADRFRLSRAEAADRLRQAHAYARQPIVLAGPAEAAVTVEQAVVAAAALDRIDALPEVDANERAGAARLEVPTRESERTVSARHQSLGASSSDGRTANSGRGVGMWLRVVQVTVALVIAAAPAALASAQAADGVPECLGTAATIVGTAGDDTLQGTDGSDVIAALGGDDVIQGGLGSDLICGGPGQDQTSSNPVTDRFPVYRDGEATVIDGGPGADYLESPDNGGHNRLIGGDGHDVLIGLWHDTLVGGTGKDQLSGGEILVRGGEGNDGFLGAGAPTYGGPGDDLATMRTVCRRRD